MSSDFLWKPVPQVSTTYANLPGIHNTAAAAAMDLNHIQNNVQAITVTAAGCFLHNNLNKDGTCKWQGSTECKPRFGVFNFLLPQQMKFAHFYEFVYVNIASVYTIL